MGSSIGELAGIVIMIGIVMGVHTCLHKLPPFDDSLVKQIVIAPPK